MPHTFACLMLQGVPQDDADADQPAEPGQRGRRTAGGSGTRKQKVRRRSEAAATAAAADAQADAQEEAEDVDVDADADAAAQPTHKAGGTVKGTPRKRKVRMAAML